MSRRQRRRRGRAADEGSSDGRAGQGDLLDPAPAEEGDDAAAGPDSHGTPGPAAAGGGPAAGEAVEGDAAGDEAGGDEAPQGDAPQGDAARSDAARDEAAGAPPQEPPGGPVDFEMVMQEAPATAAGSDSHEAPDEGPGAPEAPDAPAAHPSGGPAGRKLAGALELVGEGRVEEAIAAYREVLYEDAQNLKARNDLGVLLDEIGSHELALEQFEAARAIEPENVEVLTNLGAALGALGRYDEAERELRRAQRLEPDSVGVRASLGVLLFRRGLYAQSEAELRWVCERDETHGPAHFYRGEALNRLGRWDQALEALERAVHLQPHNARAFYTMGILYDRKHLPREAQAMYRRARELSRP